MAVTGVSAVTGGGNVDVVLPDNASGLNVTASTGGGNVTVDVGNGATGSTFVSAGSGAGDVVVHIPAGIAAKIHPSSAIGKVTVNPRYAKVEGGTYQSSDYDSAANRIEIVVKSGAGNVTVDTK
jgi:predicted membrane protein